MSSVTTAAVDVARIEKARGSKLTTASLGLAGAGILLGIAAAAVDSSRFAFSYLTGFLWVVTLGLGGLFFVIIQHLTRAGWSVAARRQAEWLAGILPISALLFIPVAVFSHDLWHHWMGEEAAHDPILVGKSGYLNTTFFFVRAAFYFAVWSGLAWFFRKHSLAQDETGDVSHTRKMQAFSAPATLLFGLTITFAGFDWLMSLDPHWFSTIFGVYVFSGAVVGSLAAMALLTIALQRGGFFKRVSTVEHMHDIGKLLFGFTVFWAYIAFSQYFLIWYANIPEETAYFLHRWEGSWKAVSLSLPILHFAVPFVLLLSRTAKRSPTIMAVASILLLVMHYVDLYWMVLPIKDHHGAHFSWIDLAGFLAPAGVLAWWLASRATSEPLYPIRDPRLAETYKAENL